MAESVRLAEAVHSIVGPSSAKRWLTCTASVGYTRDMPDKPSIYAAEGNFGHNISEYCRLEGKPASDFIGYSETIDGFEFTCDAVFADAIQQFVDYVESLSGYPLYEEMVHYTNWVESGYGTLDDGRLNDIRAHITDLKMGKGVWIDATDDPQLKMYAAGVIQDYGHMYDFKDIRLTIHQPRLNNIQHWDTTRTEIIEWMDNYVKPRAEIALSGQGAEFVAGSHCQFCPGKQQCKTRTAWVHNQLTDEMDDVTDINEMDADEIGVAYANLSTIRAWCKDIEDLALSMVQSGESIIGPDKLPLKLVEGRANRMFKDKAEAEKILRASKLLKVKEIRPPGFITIGQLEKKLGPKHEILDKILVKPRGKPVLVLGSDSRAPYTAQAEEMDDLDDDFLED